MSEQPHIPFVAVIATGCVTLVLASALAYALLLADRSSSSSSSMKQQNEQPPSAKTSTRGTGDAAGTDAASTPAASVTVYFATQTGTAESFARDLEREAAEKGRGVLSVHVADLEDVTDLGQLMANERSIFLVATYGEGDAPDNAVQFVKLLKDAAASASAAAADTGGNPAAADAADSSSSEAVPKNFEFAVFGLGNTQYDHYNAMGKWFDAALETIGGKRMVPLGLGNDDADLEADFEAWKEGQLWPALVQKLKHLFPDDDGKNSSKAAVKKKKLPDCPLQVVYHTAESSTTDYDVPTGQIHSSSRHYFTAFECPVVVVRELQQQSGDSTTASSTVHVEIDIAAAKSLSSSSCASSSSSSSNRTDGTTPLTYTTADNLGVLPVNGATVVEQVATALGYDLDAVFSVRANAGTEWHGLPFPVPCTVRECLTRYLDLTSAPRRSDLKLLAAYCNDPTDQKALLRMAAKEGREEYKKKILESYTGLVDLLKLCPSIHMPLEHLLNVCSALQTRFFTISSSSSLHPDTVHLTVAVTKHERKDGSIFHGVCSTHLAKCDISGIDNDNQALRQTATVRVFNRPSSFRLPADSSRPILMVGPGTGVAPMRAFLQERSYQRDTLKLPVGTNILYFGCKKESQDYIYKDELQAFQTSGILDHLRVAFSREQSEKVYVQHLLKQNAAETWKLLSEDTAHVYVCGGVKMGQDVSEALKEIISSQGGMSMEAAKDYLSNLSHDGRFIQELWA